MLINSGDEEYLSDSFEALRQQDPEVFELIKEEEKRQKIRINLIASENFASQASLEAQSSIAANKLAEGYLGSRFCSGCEVIDKMEKLAIDRARKLFGAVHINIQSPTATQANLAVYRALLKPGDVVLSSNISHGGHFSHGSSQHISGDIYNFCNYGTCPNTGLIDYEAMERIALEKRPKLIIAGASSYPRKIDFSVFRKIADKVGAIFMADVAHTIGLIIARLHPNPFPYADIVTSSTHKTLRGPRGGGLIMCREQFAKAIDQAVFPGLQGAPLLNIIISRAVVFNEAMSKTFVKYQQSILDNAKCLERVFASQGIKMVTGGTDTHMIIIDLRPLGLTGKQAEQALSSAGIDSNKNLIPNDDKSPMVASGLRIGTPAMTTRGIKSKQMERVGEMVCEVLNNATDEAIINRVRGETLSIAEKLPLFSKRWL